MKLLLHTIRSNTRSQRDRKVTVPVDAGSLYEGGDGSTFRDDVFIMFFYDKFWFNMDYDCFARSKEIFHEAGFQ